MLYAIVGAGQIGRSVIQDIMAEEPAARFLAIDASAAALTACQALGAERVTPVLHDAADMDGLAARLAGATVAVNCSDGGRSVEILRAAIAARANYLDVHGTLLVEERLAQSDAAAAAGVTAMMGLGCSPGLTNMLGAWGARRARPGDISVDAEYVTHRALNATSGLLETALRQFRDPVRAPVYEDGRILLHPPFAGRIVTTMPGVPGEVELVYTPHSEPLTIPRYVPGLRRVTVRGTYHPRMMALLRMLSEFGLLDPDRRVRVGEAEADFQPLLRQALFGDGAPRPAEIAPLYILRVRVTAVADGQVSTSEITVGHDPGWDPLPQGRMTALPTAYAARLIANGDFRRPGVCGPELFSDRQVEGCLAHLESRGLWIHRVTAEHRQRHPHEQTTSTPQASQD